MDKKELKNIEDFEMRCEDFYAANILECKVGTNGFCGGDSGHGSRTYFSLEDLSCTDMKIKVKKGAELTPYYDEGTYAGKVEIFLGGDTELETFISSLRWAADNLEDILKKKGQRIISKEEKFEKCKEAWYNDPKCRELEKLN